MSKVKLLSSETLETLHEHTWDLVSRFGYLAIVFNDAGVEQWQSVCEESQEAIQAVREGLGLAIEPELALSSEFIPLHISRGAILAGQILEKLATAEMTRIGIE